MQNPGSMPEPPANRGNINRWYWLLAGGALVVILIAVLVPRPESAPATSTSTNLPAGDTAAASRTAGAGRRPSPRSWNLAPGVSAEEVVTNKVIRFARQRREVLRNFAKQLNVEVPAGFEQFFDAVEAGRWEDIHDQFEALMQTNNSVRNSEGGRVLWPVISETYGVAEAAHNWPAQQLLDFGQAVLGSLRPNMVYVGGNDAGRYIPTLLNETSDGEKHVILTQNAFADSSYLRYLQFLYPDRFNALKEDDHQTAFQDYTTDAAKRLEHDQQFPNEPKQILPGENIQSSEGRVQISSHVAVMAVNEKLLQMLMTKNPELTFAICQSFPFKSTYADAAPLGPLMELRATDPQNALTAEHASESVDYWRATSQQLLANPAADSPVVRQAYAKMAKDQAALFMNRNFNAQAEENFKVACQLCPGSPEVVFSYVNFLSSQNRLADALPVVENAAKVVPADPTLRALLDHLQEAKRTGHF